MLVPRYPGTWYPQKSLRNRSIWTSAITNHATAPHHDAMPSDQSRRSGFAREAVLLLKLSAIQTKFKHRHHQRAIILDFIALTNEYHEFQDTRVFIPATL